jgi:hypothetical protein
MDNIDARALSHADPPNSAAEKFRHFSGGGKTP